MKSAVSRSAGRWTLRPQACEGKLREPSREPGTDGCEKAPVNFTGGTQPACCDSVERDLGE